MDLVSSCKDKLTYFRIKELKDILTQLGLSKQGKKQDLADRILAILSDDRVPGILAKKNVVGKDQVAKLVDDTYRRMQNPGATDLASKSPGVSASTHVKLKEEIQVSPQREKLRCLCGSSLATDSMMKCEDTRCSAWQHIKCVVIPVEGAATNPPETFYCEICRLTRADPFLVTVAHSLYPVKLNVTSIPVDGSSPGQSIEKTFQLTRADREMLLKQDVDLQAWCMLLNDKVAFRMQWPQYADLQINGVPVRVINRPGSQLLGANGRDDGPLITPYTRDGINKIALTGCDSRIFCVGVRIVKRRTLQQVLNMIPKEDKGESFEEALARVRRCVGGGAATENADSDSDIEVVADSIPVNLRCPMSGLRMKVAGRFKPCLHMGCFDLDVFVEMNQRSKKWQCPICLKNYSLEKIIIDPYFNRITSKMQNFGEDLAEIEVKPDGSWRAKLEGDQRILGELAQWHFPDGTKCTSMEAVSKPKLEPIQVKMEGGSDSHPGLKIGIKKNQNGCWVFNKPNDVTGVSPANRLREEFRNNGQNVIPMSCSSSGRDCENVSVNQDSGGNRDFTVANGLEYESLNGDPTYGFNDQITSGPAGNNEIIVLSDSDEEIEPVIRGAAIPSNTEPVAGVLPFPTPHHVIPDGYFENPTLGNEVSSPFDIYNSSVDDFGVNNMWSGIQGGPSFQLFGANTGVSDDILQGSLNCPTNVNGYTFTEDTAMRSNATIDGTLVDNPLAFSGNDPSLQIFLPTGPCDASADLRDLQDVSNDIRTEDWFSLRLGDGGGLGIGESSAANVLNSGNHLQSKDDDLDSLADPASLTVTPSRKTTREKSDSPFSFPRQKRSVRPKLNLSIHSPSE